VRGLGPCLQGALGYRLPRPCGRGHRRRHQPLRRCADYRTRHPVTVAEGGMSALLELQSVSVSIGKVALLDGIGLAVERGQILGLVGESGSGKSLTAMAAMGLLPLIGGRVTAGVVRL